jgi:hypothetical protein
VLFLFIYRSLSTAHSRLADASGMFDVAIISSQSLLTQDYWFVSRRVLRSERSGGEKALLSVSGGGRITCSGGGGTADPSDIMYLIFDLGNTPCLLLYIYFVYK